MMHMANSRILKIYRRRGMELVINNGCGFGVEFNINGLDQLPFYHAIMFLYRRATELIQKVVHTIYLRPTIICVD